MNRKLIRLGVNIDHCATVRQARYREYPMLRGGIVEPDPLAFALAAERAGADGITVHAREDGRHMQRDDVRILRECLQVPLNLEMAATDEMAAFALEVLPAYACIVPEKREEVTTEGGFDVIGGGKRLRDLVARLLDFGIETSLFIDPDRAQIDAAAAAGSPYIELHTGAYANAYPDRAARLVEYEKLQDAAEYAQSLNLTVNMGHGINYVNVVELREIPGIHEMNIGHTIVSRALFDGIAAAVRDMKRLMNPGLA